MDERASRRSRDWRRQSKVQGFPSARGIGGHRCPRDAYQVSSRRQIPYVQLETATRCRPGRAHDGARRIDEIHGDGLARTLQHDPIAERALRADLHVVVGDALDEAQRIIDPPRRKWLEGSLVRPRNDALVDVHLDRNAVACRRVRQLDLSQRYAQAHGIELDTSLQLNDFGISAFRGHNATSGRLGSFLQAVETGRVKPGSVLLVESLDRLSRSEVMDSLTLFTQLQEREALVLLDDAPGVVLGPAVLARCAG